MANDNDILSVDVKGDFNGTEEIVASYQLQLDDVGGLADTLVLEDIEEWVEALYAIVRSLLSILTVIRSFRVQNLTQDILLGEVTLATPIAGLLTGHATAPGVAILATFPTRYPRVVGAKYWGPTADEALDSVGKVDATRITVCNSAIALLTATYSATNGDYDYGYNSPKVMDFVPFTEGQSHTEPAYQRRRRRGRGS